MTDNEAAEWNAKYGAFYVIGWNPRTLRRVAVGKPLATIQAALAAAKLADARRGQFHTLDVVKPS